MSTQMKLSQKVNHFTVFESRPSTSCCWQKIPPNNLEKLAGWTCDVASGMFSLGGWWRMDWQEKVTVQSCGRALVKPKNQPEGVVLAPWWLKWSALYTADVYAAKTSNNTGYSQPRHLPVPEAAIQAREFTPATISLEWAGQSLGWKVIIQWCGYILVLIWFCLMCDLEWFL